MVTLLIVDPTGFKTQSIRTLLVEIGIEHRIKYFNTVVQALAVIEPETALQADLIILNFGLPYMHASEAILRLRAVRCLARTPMVVMVYNEWEVSHVPEADGALWLPATMDGMRGVLELIRPGEATVPAT
jgi:CheY-like chemotaxis protein